MKRTKLSSSEKKLRQMALILVLIQIIIVFTFVHMLIGSQQINPNDTKQIDIVVDDIYYFRIPRENCLFLVSDSTKYLFKSRSTFEEYSVDELYKSISEGNKLALRYREIHNIFGKVNLVVDARTETKIYRSIEEYNHGKQGVPLVVAVVFSVMELIFVGIVSAYVWLNYNTIKGIYRKTKNHLLKKK